MVYHGDCRDCHYSEDPMYPGKCQHLVHDTRNCTYGHEKCIGKAKCIAQAHKITNGAYGACPY